MEYKFIKNYRDDKVLRNAFFEFMSKVFPSIRFNEWYERGFWGDNFIPYSYVENDKIISNICVTKLEVIINGSSKKGIQIGGVGTLPEYRNNGLSRKLLNIVLEEYNNATDIFFLFANDTVLDFYPKFGFKPISEYLYKVEIDKISNREVLPFRKLDFDKSKDSKILTDLLKSRISVTSIMGARNYHFVTLWYVINFYRDSLYYFEELNAIAIIEKNKNEIQLLDVISKHYFNLEQILSLFISEELNEVIVFFPPDNYKYEYSEIIKDEQSHLFILAVEDLNLSKFHYPVTAVT